MVKGLRPPTNLTIDFKPSPKQYEMWKLLQPNCCPHCGGEIEMIQAGLDERGKPKYSPQCKKCKTRHLPRFILGGGAAGGGKAISLDDNVLTPMGFKKMRDIQLGDEVSTPDGRTAHVIAIHPQGKVRLWELTTNDGITVKCCDDHIWRVNIHDKMGPHEVITDTRHVRAWLDKGKKISIGLTEPVHTGAKYDSFIHPYIIGFLIGNGGLTGNMTFTTVDLELVDKIRSLVPAGCVVEKIRSSKYSYIIKNKCISSQGRWHSPFKNEIIRLGLRHDCHTKRIPKFILSGDYDVRLNCVQGLMDSDGYVDKRGHCSFSVCNEGLARDFLSLVRSLGATATISSNIKHCYYKGEKKSATAYTVRFNCKHKADFITLKRRRARIPEKVKVWPRFITQIKNAGVREAQCISIDACDGMFITNDYLPTHNSYVGSCWIIMNCIRFPGNRAVIARKTLKTLKSSTFNTVKYVLRQWGFEQDVHFKINNIEGIVTFWNESTISLIELEDLPSDPEFERLGSNEWSNGFIDECSQVSEKAVEILYSRLRWLVPEHWGYPRLLMTTNPSMNWVRSRFVQDDDGNKVKLADQDAFVQYGVFDNPNKAFVATYRDALDKLSDPVARHRLLYGVWDWVGENEAAAYWNFEGNIHLKDNLRETVYDPLKPLVISWDFNVAPFMSTLVLQVDYEARKIYVLEEILGRPEDKENNTPKLAEKISKKYLSEAHMGGVIITGDPAGLARSTQTEAGVNNYTIIMDHMHPALHATKSILPKQPPQKTRLEFINKLLAGDGGWEILIDMRCRKLTEDFIYQRKTQTGEKDKSKISDPKLGIKYERYGHLSDAFDYAICLLLKKEYGRFQTGSVRSEIVTSTSEQIYGDFSY